MSAAAAARLAFAVVLFALAALPAPSIDAQVVAPGSAQRPARPPRDVAPSPTTAGGGRISGRIVHAETGAPMRRALVTLAGESLRRQVTTDADGRYQFGGLAAGRYSISAGKGGYLTLQYGQRRPFEPGRPVTLASGESLDRVDLVLPRGSAIDVRITDDRGEAVAGAEVRVERYQYAPTGDRALTLVPPVMRTNDLGEVRAFGLMPGEYVVSASVRQMPMPPGQRDPIGPRDAFLQTFHPGTTTAAAAESITLGVGEEAAARFTMARGRLSRVSGTVTDSAGRPAAGARLTLATRARGSSMASSASAGTVAADGTFSIGSIPPGEHFVQVVLPPPPGSGAAAEIAIAPIAVAGDDVGGVQVSTSAGVMVEGVVEWDGRAPRTSAAGAPLRIVADAGDGRPAIVGSLASMGATGLTANGTVGRDDTFRIGGLIGSVLFSPAGVPPQWMLKAVIVNGADVTSVPTDTATLAPATAVRVVLTDRVTEIAGAVRNAQGQPVREYVAVVLPENPVAPAVAARYTRTVRPDQSGAFLVRALPPGRYLAIALEALEPGTEWDPSFRSAIQRQARRVSIGEGERVRLDLDLEP